MLENNANAIVRPPDTLHYAFARLPTQFMSVAYSPDGKSLASGSYDNTVRVWEAATGKLLLTLEGHADGVNSVAYKPDGKSLASGS